MQQFEQPPFASPFYPPGYTYGSPPPGMPPRSNFYQEGFGASIPTPAPSPRTPSSRRRSSQHPEFMGSSEYVSGKRPSSFRRPAHEHAEFSHEQYNTTSPRPGVQYKGVPYMHTPVHTPPPTSHAYHNMPNISSYVPGFVPQDFTAPTPGPQSPPPRDGRRSRTHRRESTWSGEPTPRSPPRFAKPSRASTDPASIDPDMIRRKAAALGIPADYSLKNWDPNERPVILLGSVFDANSLGEWIFNWTKYHHGRSHEATKTAGGLWGLLIELSSKLKRTREFYDQIKGKENREILDEFVDSGERLWGKLKGLLKACEEYMWRGARGVASPRLDEGKTVQMGKKSGAEFVDAMFNGVKEWESTERLMRGMVMWCQRFEANCEDILRCPNA